MDLEARVVSLQDYPAGLSVGYDRAEILEADSRLACVSLGYQNGFRRCAAGQSEVLINNHAAPVVGKISMNAIIVDVTGIQKVRVGDIASIFGGQRLHSVSSRNAEQQFSTIMADLYSDWGMRNQRVINGSKELE